MVEVDIVKDKMMQGMLISHHLEKWKTSFKMNKSDELNNGKNKGLILSKKERKKLIKKSKKIQKTQKKREQSEVIQNLLSKSPKVSFFREISRKELQKSKWGEYVVDNEATFSVKRCFTRNNKLSSRNWNRDRSNSPENYKQRNPFKRSFSYGGNPTIKDRLADLHR